jgi:hypothetical protein
MMLRYLISFYKYFKKEKTDKSTYRQVEAITSLAMRKYKVAIIELYHIAGHHRKRLIITKTKRGKLWSKKQYNKILAKSFKDHIHLSYGQCASVIDYERLKNDFTYWSKKFFLARS